MILHLKCLAINPFIHQSVIQSLNQSFLFGSTLPWNVTTDSQNNGIFHNFGVEIFHLPMEGSHVLMHCRWDSWLERFVEPPPNITLRLLEER